MTQPDGTHVVTVGESMILFQALADGPLQYASLFNKSIAGAESNVAIGLSRLGKKVRWISRLGRDPFGDTILGILGGEGVDTRHVIRDDSAPTAVYFKEFKGYGDPTVYYYRRGSAASHLSPADIQPAWLDNARHLHVTGITPALGASPADTVRVLLEQAGQQGLTRSFDPNLRRKLWPEAVARDTLLSLVPLCDVFLPGLEEAQFLLGDKSLEEYGRAFLDLGPSVVCIKLGDQGSVAFTRTQQVQAPPYRVQRVVDTVGAGDAFAAGFLSVLLDQEQPLAAAALDAWLPAALARANLMGALATQWKGDWEGLPKLSEVAGLLAGQGLVTR